MLFDLHQTLVYPEVSVSEEEISAYLNRGGYEISPQQLKAAFIFTSFIDYPRYGYKDWHTFLRRTLWRLRAGVDRQTLNGLVSLMERNKYRLYPDAREAVKRAKQLGLKTAIVTTIARFKFQDAIEGLEGDFDYIMTGYEARCDKSNPRMYKKLLEVLRVMPEESVVIGDDLHLDILLPERLGMNAILLDREGRGQNDVAPEAVVQSLTEAIEIVRKMGSSSAVRTEG
ncbi:MAG: HAD family hydrolase [Thermoplasmata archaeon]